MKTQRSCTKPRLYFSKIFRPTLHSQNWRQFVKDTQASFEKIKSETKIISFAHKFFLTSLKFSQVYFKFFKIFTFRVQKIVRISSRSRSSQKMGKKSLGNLWEISKDKGNLLQLEQCPNQGKRAWASCQQRFVQKSSGCSNQIQRPDDCQKWHKGVLNYLILINHN